MLARVSSSEKHWLLEYPVDATGGAYDEVFARPGEPRQIWQRLVSTLSNLGRDELKRRWEQARRLLREHGAGYDAYGDSGGAARPWNLSLVPVVIGSDEWAQVSKGLEQRARLLDAILADIYGPRRLLASADLPPEIAFAHPGFLRPCVGIEPRAKRYLPLYAADLARRPDGNFVVLADRTRAPSGAGYALENRIIVSRSLPEAFRECNVDRLALFFRTVQSTLRDLAPKNRDNPRIVLLTPGPYNGAYFEQAFLSQYLGLTLVQGEDLMVRDQKVYLKTLGGLQSVDVILRRLHDDFCDPLELRPESLLGVPGLLEASRSGSVALANPVGSALLQSPLIMAFLPAICRKLLGEDLAIPSLPTRWCGDPRSLAYVDAHLGQLVLRPLSGGAANTPIFAGNLSAQGLAELRARVYANPRAYVAQESFVLSTVPTLEGDGLVPAHLWMRAYLVASGGGYDVMPGALSRVGGRGERHALSLRPGGESKDTWVLAGGPVSTFSLLRSTSTLSLSRGGGDLPSRVADNLFWLGRYAERAESAARLARAIAVRLFDQQAAAEAELTVDLEALFRALAAQTGVSPTLGSTGWEEGLLASVFDGEPSGTLRATIGEMYRVARTVRDRISADTWRTVVQIRQDVQHAHGALHASALAALMDILNRVVIGLAAFSGLGTESMSRGFAWRFLDAGRRLERGLQTTSLLRAALVAPCSQEGPVLEALLEVADSSMTYRRRYLAALEVAPVVDLLLTDETNPRSVLFQVNALAEHVDALPRDEGMTPTAQQKVALQASSELKLANVSDACTADDGGARPRLERLLDAIGDLLPELSNALSAVYLGHSGSSPSERGDA